MTGAARNRARRAALLLAALATSCAAAPTSSADRTPPPNVVIFLVDDLGWQDLSAPFWRERTPWNERYHTPNVERLCREGTKFTAAYAHCVCTPTRVSLLTGMAAARHRVTHWTLRADTPTDPERGGLRRPVWNWNGLTDTDATANATLAATLPQRLAAAGYHTILAGKAHFGAAGTPGADPCQLGFDVNIAGWANGAPSSYLAQTAFLRAGDDPIWQVSGLERYHGQDLFLTDVLTTEALAAAGASVAAQQPFLLYLAHYAVHAPFDADERFAARYRDAGLPEREARYAALIEGADHSLGRVLDWLDARGLAEDTVVLFLSDNGGLSAHGRAGEPHTHNTPLRSGKGSAYEGGVRVPLAVRWPGRTPAGVELAVPVSVDDVFPTVCELAGADPRCPDGVAFTPALRGQPLAPHPVFWHHPHWWGATGPGIEPYSGVRDGRYKLLWFYAGGRAELYDVIADIGERHDLAAELPEVTTRLRALLRRQLADCGATLPRGADGAVLPLP
ncbi:MAG: sulfatase [Planctomycetes bacterium]|nr:sulfatase [Planctomycetota bacterium]